jgi:hypothetical protein
MYTFKKIIGLQSLKILKISANEVSNLRPKAIRAISTMFDQNKKHGVRL